MTYQFDLINYPIKLIFLVVYSLVVALLADGLEVDLVELCLYCHLLIAGGAGEVVDAPRLVERREDVAADDLVTRDQDHITRSGKKINENILICFIKDHQHCILISQKIKINENISISTTHDLFTTLTDLVAHVAEVAEELVVVRLAVGQPLPLVVLVPKERLLALGADEVLHVPVLACGDLLLFICIVICAV